MNHGGKLQSLASSFRTTDVNMAQAPGRLCHLLEIQKITRWFSMTNALLEEMAPTARNSHYTTYFKAWSPITFLFHYCLRDINAFHLPIRPHFTLKKGNVGRGGKGLAPSIPPLLLFVEMVPNFDFFGISRLSLQ